MNILYRAKIIPNVRVLGNDQPAQGTRSKYKIKTLISTSAKLFTITNVDFLTLGYIKAQNIACKPNHFYLIIRRKSAVERHLQSTRPPKLAVGMARDG